MSAPGLEPEAEPELIPSFDGSLLAGRRRGAGEATPLLVCNAVGDSLTIWRRALTDLVAARAVVSWDLRGLHSSGPPRTRRLDPAAQAEDGIAVADHFGLERFALAAWSNGARIALEIARLYPERVTAMVLVCGGAGQRFADALRHLELGVVLPPIMGVAKHFSGYLGGVYRAVVGRPELPGLVRQSGLMGPAADVGAAVDLVRGMAGCDPRTLLETFEAVAGDSALDALETVEAPTLAVAGGRDRIVPLRAIEAMVRAIPGAHLEIYDEAAHYLPLELPARLAQDMQAWFASHE